MKDYLLAAWAKYVDKIFSGSITKDKAQQDFFFDFGANPKACRFKADKLVIERIPPKAD